MAFKLFDKDEDKKQTTPDAAMEGAKKEKTSAKEPLRDDNGKFVSKKEDVSKTSKTESKKEKKVSPEKVIGPILISFYGKDVRRFYKNKKWYFAIDDIINLAQINNEDPTQPEGDPEKLKEIRKKSSIKIKYRNHNREEITLECIDAKTASEVPKYVRGRFPGAFNRWIKETSEIPYSKDMISEADSEVPEEKKEPLAYHPSESGR